MRKILKIFPIILIMMTVFACGIDRREVQAFEEKIEELLSEIKMEYDIGEYLPTELSDGTKVEWIITGSAKDYFDDETYYCLGTDKESGSLVDITALFRHQEISELVIEHKFTNIKIKDSNIRNSETGIPDENLYKYLVVLADSNHDGKISKLEALELKGPVEIIKDNEGIVAKDTIKTTKGLHLFPNITSLKFTNLKIESLIIEGITELESLVFANDQSQITNFNVSNQSKLKTINLGKSYVNNVHLGNPLTVVDLDLSLKNIASFTVSDAGVTVYKLDLSANRNLSDYSFLSRIHSLELLNLNGCDLSKTKTDTFPAMNNLKELNISNNQNILVYDFLQASKYPNLEVIDFSSNKIVDLSLSDFNNLKKIKLEQLKIGDIYHINELRLVNLPKFEELARSSEVRILKIYIDNLPALSRIDLSFHDSFDIFSTEKLTIKNSGVKSIIKNDLTSILHLELEGLLALKELNLIKTGLIDVKFTNMNNLETLLLDYCPLITDYAFLAASPNLLELSVSNNQVSNANLDSIKLLSKLKKLNLSNNSLITNYQTLSSLINLEGLNLRNNSINNDIIATLPVIASLKELILTDNRSITNLSLIGYDSLETLDVSSSSEIWQIDNLVLKDLPKFVNFKRKNNTKLGVIHLENLAKLASLNLANSNFTKLTFKNVPLLNLILVDNEEGEIING